MFPAKRTGVHSNSFDSKVLADNELISCSFTHHTVFCRRIHSFTLFTDWRVPFIIKRFLLLHLYHVQTTFLACEITFSLTRSSIFCVSLYFKTFFASVLINYLRQRSMNQRLFVRFRMFVNGVCEKETRLCNLKTEKLYD
jgi:hypothetical protein